MPTYQYHCTRCFQPKTIFKALKDLDRTEKCACAGLMQREITAPAVRGDYAAYDCPITGKRIEGRRAHEENLKRHGCRVLEPGETEGAKRGFAAADAALDTAIEKTAEEFVEKLPSAEREALGTALESGLDLQLTRN